MGKPFGGDIDQPARQFFRRGVGIFREDDLVVGFRGQADRFHDRRMAVTVVTTHQDEIASRIGAPSSSMR